MSLPGILDCIFNIDQTDHDLHKSDDGGKPGQYRCDLCEPPMQLHSEVLSCQSFIGIKCHLTCWTLTFEKVELENHVVSEGHKKAGALLAPLTSFPHGGGAEKGKGRGRGRGKGKLDPTRGKVYRGRPNALSADTMKAQRGRRGLISFGEVSFVLTIMGVEL